MNIEYQFAQRTTHFDSFAIGHQRLPDDPKETVNALEDGDHHLVLVLGGGFILRMRARVDDPVHVEVQVVELDLVGVRPCRVHLGPDAVYLRVLHRGGMR